MTGTGGHRAYVKRYRNRAAPPTSLGDPGDDVPYAIDQPLSDARIVEILHYWDALPDLDRVAQPERVFCRAVIKKADELRLLKLVIPDSRKVEGGWPDLTFVGPGGAAAWEAKIDKNGVVRLEPRQPVWGRALGALSAMTSGRFHYQIITPADYGIGGTICWTLAAISRPPGRTRPLRPDTFTPVLPPPLRRSP